MKLFLLIATTTTLVSMASALQELTHHHRVGQTFARLAVRHLQPSDFELFCELVTMDSQGESTCACSESTRSITCQTIGDTCAGSVCFQTKTSLTLTEDFQEIDKVNVCIDYTKGAPTGLEEGCVDLFLTGGLISDCDMRFGGVTCNDCRICSSNEELEGTVDIDCSNIQSSANTNGCQPFSDTASLFPTSGGVTVPTGVLATVAAVGAVMM